MNNSQTEAAPSPVLETLARKPPPIVRFIRPFQQFTSNEASGGLLLLGCAIAALLWANSPWSNSYEAFWHTSLEIGVAGHVMRQDLHFWVNDLLMVLFFFVVGLEIKREMLVGELASPRKAALPILAALGGVVVPALIYTAFNFGTPNAHGWGIPMATDIAFALGVLVLLGDRIPSNLKVFLAALAIADDIAAVIVIAVFYTASFSLPNLAWAALFVLLLFLCSRLGVRHPLPYALLGVCLWLAVLRSGIHATIAGVILAFTIPARTAIDQRDFLNRCRKMLDRFERSSKNNASVLTDGKQQAAIESLEDACERVQPPLYRFEHALHPWVTFVIMPLFALANAGVSLSGDLAAKFVQPVTLGVLIGLLLGKPIGVTLASWLSVRAGWATLPPGVSWRHIHGAGWLAGIGFTMSLFVAGLSFKYADALNMAKLGVLSGSLCAGLLGSAFLLQTTRHPNRPAIKQPTA